VLGLPWSTKADVFSMACIFFEVFHGARLFDVNDDLAHLAAFEKRLTKLPLTFTKQSKHFKRFFDEKGALLRLSTTPTPARHIGEIVMGAPEFLGLLMAMLHIDPHQRISAQEALKHPFLCATPTPHRKSLSPQHVDASRQCDKENAAPVTAKPVIAAVAVTLPTTTAAAATKFGVMNPARAQLPMTRDVCDKVITPRYATVPRPF